MHDALPMSVDQILLLLCPKQKKGKYMYYKKNTKRNDLASAERCAPFGTVTHMFRKLDNTCLQLYPMLLGFRAVQKYIIKSR